MKTADRDAMERKLDALCSGGRLEDRAVFPFGHCNATEELIDCLLARGITPSAILDNNEAKAGLAYRGVPVRPPAWIRDHFPGNSMVLVAARFYEAMKAQLRGLGYGGPVVKLVEYDSFAEYSLSAEVFSRKRERVLRGAETLTRIRREYPDTHLTVCPYDALGDVYRAMSFLPAYCEKHGIGESVPVVAGAGCEQVAALFCRRAIPLSQREMDELVQALLFIREKNCLIAHHDRPYTDRLIRYLDRGFLSFADYYRFGVFGLDGAARAQTPTGGAVVSHPASLVRGKTVILAPYAKSVVRPPEAFWAALAEGFRQQGLLVCTSVFGEEKAVLGTRPLSLSIRELTSAAEYAGHFVGLRSGLCDILESAQCRKTVVFPHCVYSTTGWEIERFFDLPGWEKITYRDAECGEEGAQGLREPQLP